MEKGKKVELQVFCEDKKKSFPIWLNTLMQKYDIP